VTMSPRLMTWCASWRRAQRGAGKRGGQSTPVRGACTAAGIRFGCAHRASAGAPHRASRACAPSHAGARSRRQCTGGRGGVCQTWRLRIDRSAWMVSVTTFIVPARCQNPCPHPAVSRRCLAALASWDKNFCRKLFCAAPSLCMLVAPLRQVLLATKPALTPAKQQHPDDRWYTGVSGLAEFF